MTFLASESRWKMIRSGGRNGREEKKKKKKMMMMMMMMMCFLHFAEDVILA